MGLLRSDAGVPWGAFDFVAQELTFYTAALVEGWVEDPRKLAWAASHGWRTDNCEGLLHVVALAMWDKATDLMMQARFPTGYRVRQIAEMDRDAYRVLDAMDFASWVQAAEATNAAAIVFPPT